MRKRNLILISLAVVMLISFTACQPTMTDEEILERAEEILAENATPTPEPTPEIPDYIVEGIYGGSKFITVLANYTEDGLFEIVKIESLDGTTNLYFFEPDVPKKNYKINSWANDNLLPDKEYKIMDFSYINDRWQKFK